MSDGGITESTPAAANGRRARRVRERAARAMIASAVVGVLVALVGTLIGWQLLGQIDRTTGESVRVSEQALDSIENTIELADSVVASTTVMLGTIEQTMRTASSSFSSTEALVEDLVVLADTTGPGLRRVGSTLEQLAEVGTSVDAVLGAVSALPLAPNYDPDAGLGETMQRLADDVEPLGVALEDVSVSLADAAVPLSALNDDLTTLADEVAALDSTLAETQLLLDGYRANVASARQVAADASADLDGNLTWMRLLVVVGGLNFALAQIVPFWFGAEQLRLARDVDADPVVASSD